MPTPPCDHRYNRCDRFGLYGIVGYPLRKTVSPAMMNAAFRHHRLPYVYLPFPVEPRYAKKIVTTLRLLDLLGGNVTAPYKERLIDDLDDVDGESRKIGAINTIVNRQGKLIGLNTDGAGFIASLARQRIGLRDRRITLIGAGGVAAAIAYQLSRLPIKSLAILNRHPKRAVRLADRFDFENSGKIDAAGLTPTTLRHFLPQTDLLIYAVPVDLPNLPIQLLPSPSLISDLRYLPNRLARQARKQKRRYYNGLAMVVAQAELSYQAFTGKRIAASILQRAAVEFLTTGVL